MLDGKYLWITRLKNRPQSPIDMVSKPVGPKTKTKQTKPSVGPFTG